MPHAPRHIVILGLSITASWGNGHATTYRALAKGLHRLGHTVLFLERDKPWYAANRDLADPPFCRIGLYDSLDDLHARYRDAVRDADAVVVGSYVPEGVAVGSWALEQAHGPVAFYDIDTPVTLAKLAAADHEYLSPELVRRYHVYLSFTGGPLLRRLEQTHGASRAEALYCSVDTDLYRPVDCQQLYDCGYMGTYSADRQESLERLLLEPAQRLSACRFAVAGPQYPADIAWPPNVDRIDHIPPAAHCRFYNEQRFTLNLTRADMRREGFSPSVRLFEAAACGVPIISDHWTGIETYFEPGREILISARGDDTIRHLAIGVAQRRGIAEEALKRVRAEHTAECRAQQLLRIVAG
jgi:spore maturation protein CgeB